MYPAIMTAYRVISYNGAGVVLRDFTADVDVADGPHFIAHQTLHADDVVCVEIRTPDGSVMLRQCDPGVDFRSVVVASDP